MTFAADVAFLSKHARVVTLSSPDGRARLVVVPAWQGRVMTSTAQGTEGRSFGWINRKLISSGQTLPHFNPLGGEDRLWLGPEGGQFSIFFAQGAPFDLEHWSVPRAFDTQPFEVVDESPDHVSLEATFGVVNYTGTHFQVRVEREVRLLEPAAAWKRLVLPPVEGISLVAYESRNTLTNEGESVWSKQSGLLSIWILGMFNPSPESTIVIPIRAGPDSVLGRKVTSDYFGRVPQDRLKVTENAVFLKADGQFRSKVGVNPQRSLGRLGSYDALHRVLTIVQFDQPTGVTDYVNSLWKLQADPYGGDAANAYNDGPPTAGVPAMGPFFELESSSPAAELAPGASLSHVHRTLHLTGPEDQLSKVSEAVLGVSLAEIKASFSSLSTHP